MASERIMAHDGNVIDDTTFATGDDNSHIHTTAAMGTHEHNDEILSTTGDNKISAPPPAAASTYYTSFNEEEAPPAEYSTSIIDSTQVVNQPPPAAATTNNNNSASKKASIEYEQLLSSTIISLFQKFVPALHQRLSSSSNNNDDETNRSELVLQSSRSLEFADGYGGNYKTTGLDNDDDDDDAVLDVESQSFSASPYPSERISTTATPKVSNLKTTGLLDSSDTIIDNDESAHNYTNYHHHQSHHQSHQQQQQHQLQRQHSNSSEYLPQSAAVLLNTLQHTNFDRGAEEILSSILRSGGSSSFDEGDANDVIREGGGSGELVVDGNDDEVGVNADGSASKKKLTATTKTQEPTTKSTNNSFEQQSQQQQQQQHNYDDDDDNSISGDMARLSKSIAHLQRDLDNIDMSRFDGMVDMEQQDLLHDGSGSSSRSNGWKRWIRNWLLSHGIIEDEKMVNSLLSDDDIEIGGDDNGSIITPGRGGFTIFDFERDYVLVLTLLLVFFVLLRNRFKTMNELMFEEDNQDLEGLLGGSDW